MILKVNSHWCSFLIVIYKNSNSFQIFMTELNYFSTWRFYDWFPLSKFAINSMHIIYHVHMLFVFFLKAYIFTMTATTSLSKKFHRKIDFRDLTLFQTLELQKLLERKINFISDREKGFKQLWLAKGYIWPEVYQLLGLIKLNFTWSKAHIQHNQEYSVIDQGGCIMHWVVIC